jgi:predicted dehydrogenase
MSGSLGIGIVGCGYWGPNLARNFAALPGVAVRALCDPDPARLEHMRRLHPQAELCREYPGMLAVAGVDAVAVATPVALHHPVAKASLLAGKHVLVEKPLAASSAHCAELIETARRMGRVLMVDHTYLYSAPVRRIAEIIRSGEIGEVKYINCQRLNLGLFQDDINVAWDLAAHDLSIIVHLLGDLPSSVNCQGGASITPGVEDVTNMSLHFRNGCFATIQSSWLEPRKVRQITIVGSKRTIVYDDVRSLEKIRIHDVRIETPPHYDSFAEFQYSYHYGDCLIPRLDQREPLGAMCEHFAACVNDGTEPLTDGRRGLEIVRILEAASASLRAAGAPVALEDRRGAGGLEPAAAGAAVGFVA